MEFRIKYDENITPFEASYYIASLLKNMPLQSLAQGNCFSLEDEGKEYFIRANNVTKEYIRLYVWKGENEK